MSLQGTAGSCGEHEAWKEGVGASCSGSPPQPTPVSARPAELQAVVVELVNSPCKASRQRQAEPPPSASTAAEPAAVLQPTHVLRSDVGELCLPDYYDLCNQPDSPRKEVPPAKPFLTKPDLDVLLKDRESERLVTSECQEAQHQRWPFFEQWVVSDAAVLERITDQNAGVVPEQYEISELILDCHQSMCGIFSPSAGKVLTLTVKDFDCLKGTEWLNMDMMDVYMCLLHIQHTERCKLDPDRCQPCAFLPTVAYDLVKDTSNTDQRLEKILFGRHNVWKSDRVFFPIHIDKVHWALVMACRSKSTLTFYDSDHKPPPLRCLEVLGAALNANRRLHEPHAQAVQWKHVIDKNIPKQTDRSSCGLFVCATTDCLAAGRAVAGFNNDMMSTMRMKLRQFLCSCRPRSG